MPIYDRPVREDGSDNLLFQMGPRSFRGYDRVVGQLLRYMRWISKNLAEENQEVRGMIVANEISEDLRLACSRVPGVQLFEYDLAVQVRAIDSS